jgi:hypothetical protein
MATKADKDKIAVEKTTSQQEVVLKLWVAVASGEMSMQIAEKQLRDYVDSLPEDQKEEFRFKARTFGRLLMSVTEAFSQVLTVIAAGQ